MAAGHDLGGIPEGKAREERGLRRLDEAQLEDPPQ